MKKTIVLLFSLCLIACQENEPDPVTDIQKELIGNWQLIEINISNGEAKPIKQPVQNGGIITFDLAGSFNSTLDESCASGTYTVVEQNLQLSCNQGDVLSFSIDFRSSNTFTLVPTQPVCIEGCSYLYNRVS